MIVLLFLANSFQQLVIPLAILAQVTLLLLAHHAVEPGIYRAPRV